MRPADTSPEEWRQFNEILNRMTPSEKLERAFKLTTRLFRRTEAVLRERYPNASEREIFLRRARINVGRDLFVKAYGDVLDYDGRDDNLMLEIREEMNRNLVRDLLNDTALAHQDSGGPKTL